MSMDIKLGKWQRYKLAAVKFCENEHVLPLLFLFALTCIMVTFASPHIFVKQPGEIFAPTDITQFMGKDESHYRVFDTAGYLPHHLAARNHIQLVNGYDPFILTHYLSIMNLVSGNEHQYSPSELPLEHDRNFSISTIQNWHILSMLNTKYIIADRPANQTFLDLVYYNPSFTRYVQIGGAEYGNKTGPLYIYQNKNALPRACVVRNATVADEETILNHLNSNFFNPRQSILLQEQPDGMLTNRGEFKEAQVTFYSPNKIIVEVELDDPGFLVLSEIWYPRWKVYDNGQEKNMLKTNYALRSVYLEQGNHTVEWIYETELDTLIKWVKDYCVFDNLKAESG